MAFHPRCSEAHLQSCEKIGGIVKLKKYSKHLQLLLSNRTLLLTKLYWESVEMGTRSKRTKEPKLSRRVDDACSWPLSTHNTSPLLLLPSTTSQKGGNNLPTNRSVPMTNQQQENPDGVIECDTFLVYKIISR